MNTIYNKLLKGGLLLIFLLLLSNISKAQTFLEIPVKLEIEKGDLDNVLVKVKKDGKDAFTQSGASKMRFKFDFNRKYTLIFTKPGYITKTIEINSKAPSARITQGFDPYKIGVKLFKQNDENKVVYNQAVAHIKYDQNLDEFNFDTDYSKSILSAITMDDESDKTAEKTKEKEPDPIETNPILTTTTPTPTEEVTKNEPSNPSITSASDPIPSDKGKTASINQDVDPSKPYTPASGSDEKSIIDPNSGDDSKKIASVNNGSDTMKGGNSSDGDDKSKLANVNAGKEKKDTKLKVTQGDEKPNYYASTQSGYEQQNSPDAFKESENITREDIIEKNRVITKVRVMKGTLTTEYSRVNYSWGGLYFFKNSSTSIPENLFVQWTGVRE